MTPGPGLFALPEWRSHDQTAEQRKPAQACLETRTRKAGERVPKEAALWAEAARWRPPLDGLSVSSAARPAQTAPNQEQWSYGNALWVSLAKISACVKAPLSLSLACPHISQTMDPASCTNVMSFQAGALESPLSHQEQGAGLPPVAALPLLVLDAMKKKNDLPLGSPLPFLKM